MKGLLLREFYLGRKYYILSLLMFLLVMTISLLVNLSTICGNLSRLPEDSVFQINENALTMLKILPYLVIFISFCTDGGVTFSDYKTNWMKYCGTTPMSEKKIVIVKFAAKMITLAAAFILCIIYTAVLGGITSTRFTFSAFKNLFMIFSLAVLFSYIFLTLSIGYKDKNAVTIRLIAIFAALYIPCMIYMVTFMNNSSEEDVFSGVVMPLIDKFKSIVFPLSPVIIILSVAVCYLLSVRFMKRREN